MLSYEEIERRIKQRNAEICENCYRDNCDDCDKLTDPDDAYDAYEDSCFYDGDR